MMKFENFDPAYFLTLRSKAKKGTPRPDLIRAIAEAEERSSQAEINLNTSRDLRAETNFRIAAMKRRKK